MRPIAIILALALGFCLAACYEQRQHRQNLLPESQVSRRGMESTGSNLFSAASFERSGGGGTNSSEASPLGDLPPEPILIIASDAGDLPFVITNGVLNYTSGAVSSRVIESINGLDWLEIARTWSLPGNTNTIGVSITVDTNRHYRVVFP